MFDDGLQVFVNEVNKIPRLDAEEEKRLARRWRDHRDTEAAHRMICSQLGYVVAMAVKYRRYHIPVNDLVAEGNVGLLRALDKFDPERDIRFVTYAAFWVRSQIVSCVLKNWSVANSGAGALKSKTFFKLRREGARARALLGDGPEFFAEVANRTGIALGKVKQMLAYLDANDVSLDEPIWDGPDQTTRLDLVTARGDAGDEILEEKQTQSLSRDLIGSGLKSLDRREAFIIQHRYLVADDEELSLAELGRRLDISRERARQLQERAMQKLRKHLDSRLRSSGLSKTELLPAA